MVGVRHIHLLMLLPVLLLGCGQHSDEGIPLFDGEWIDIEGHGRTAEDACGGTFDYIDTYAGALAREFGPDAHLGVYRWYSPAKYDAELPCGAALPYPSACAVEGHVLHTPFVPHEHELVHLANQLTGMCPSVVAEGLAEYYGVTAKTPNSTDVELLAARLDVPDEKIPASEYAISGRFMAYLVDMYGVAAVLDVCRVAGREPDGDELSMAMMNVMGQSSSMLFDAFATEFVGGPSSCNDAERYQSRVFACGVAAAAPEVGLVDGTYVGSYELDCDSTQTIGPFVDTVRTAERIDLDADASYLVRLQPQGDVDIATVRLTLAACGPCGRVTTLVGDSVDVVQLEAGRYSLELSAPATLSQRVIVTIQR